MRWKVKATDEFETWIRELSLEALSDVAIAVDQLELRGPHLTFPKSSDVKSSRYSHMRELRIQHKGHPLRVLYAFDPLRTAVLLLGGDKTGDARWYKRNVPIADALYDAYLRHLSEEGLI